MAEVTRLKIEVQDEKGQVYYMHTSADVVFLDDGTTVETALTKKVEAAGGDISNTAIKTADKATEDFPVPAAGTTAKSFLGKMKKFCEDFNDFKTGILTVGKLVNNATTTKAGVGALDAAMGKTLGDRITQLNSDLANGAIFRKKLTEKDDLNKLTQNGIYYYTTSSIPQNSPFKNAGIVEVIGSNSDTTQKLQRVTRYGLTGQAAFRPMGDDNIWFDWSYYLTSPNTPGDGWNLLTPTGKFENYPSITCQYRREGNIVEIIGTITPTEIIPAGSERQTFFNLPVGYRPIREVVIICQGTNSNRWALTVRTDGNCGVSRYGITKFEDITPGNWLPFHAIFFTA